MLMNDRLLSYLIFFLLATSLVSAQDDDKIKKMKISFFTDQLDLSTEEAQQFWPIYNHHNDRYEDLKENKWRGIVKRLKKHAEYEFDKKLLDRYRSSDKKK